MVYNSIEGTGCSNQNDSNNRIYWLRSMAPLLVSHQVQEARRGETAPLLQDSLFSLVLVAQIRLMKTE